MSAILTVAPNATVLRLSPTARAPARGGTPNITRPVAVFASSQLGLKAAVATDRRVMFSRRDRSCRPNFHYVLRCIMTVAYLAVYER